MTVTERFLKYVSYPTMSCSDSETVPSTAKQKILGADIAADETLCKHAEWTEELKKEYAFTEENTMDILKKEVGKVFMQVLCDAGVYKRTEEGKNAFLRFVNKVNE